MVRGRGGRQQGQRGRGGNELLTRNSTHASRRAYDEPDFRFRARSRRMTIAYDQRIEPILTRFGLNHIAKLGAIKADVALITALVERWRRETHTFHLPTGEITPTLQDVCCLLGLPVNGAPIIGLSDENWEEDVAAAFGHCDWWAFAKPPGTFHMTVEWLRHPYVPHGQEENMGVKTVLPVDASPEEIRRYAISFICMSYYLGHLLGWCMFGDYVLLYCIFCKYNHSF